MIQIDLEKRNLLLAEVFSPAGCPLEGKDRFTNTVSQKGGPSTIELACVPDPRIRNEICSNCQLFSENPSQPGSGLRVSVDPAAGVFTVPDSLINI